MEQNFMHGSVRLTFGEFSTGYRTGYLVLFSVPPHPRFQANRTITKTWRVNSSDPWLAGENHHCLRHWTCGTRHNRPARFKSAQPAKDAHVLNERTSLLTPKMFYVVCWGSTDCRLIDSRGTDPVRAWWRAWSYSCSLRLFLISIPTPTLNLSVHPKLTLKAIQIYYW